MKRKVKLHQYEGVPITVYKALFNDKLVAISLKKSLLVNYMEFHRGLTPEGYEIIKDQILDSTYYTQYEDYELCQFYGYYLPRIDVSYIAEDFANFEGMLQDTVNKMTYLIYLCHRTKGMETVEEEGKNFLIDLMAETKKDKKMERMEKAHDLSHPLILMRMDEYLETMKSYKEIQLQKDHLRSIVDDGRSDWYAIEFLNS